MNLGPELKLDWCSYEAAKFAVEHWYYRLTSGGAELGYEARCFSGQLAETGSTTTEPYADRS